MELEGYNSIKGQTIWSIEMTFVEFLFHPTALVRLMSRIWLLLRARVL